MMINLVVLIQAFLIFVALNLLLIAYLAWRHPHRAPEATSIALLCLVSAIYCLGYAGEVAQTGVGPAFFWLHVEYLGTPWIPALWLLAARQFNRLPERRVLLFTVPVLTFLSQQTNSLHHLFDRTLHMVPNGPFWTVAAERGPFAWLHLAYLFFALLYGLGIYLFGPAQTRYSRQQKLVLATLALAPLAGYLLYLLGLSPWGLDIAPATLGITVLSGYFAIFRLGCFEMMPAVHSLVFNNIRDAVLTVNRERLLVDLNPAARRLLAEHAPETPLPIGGFLPAPFDTIFDAEGNHFLDLSTDPQPQHFEVRVFPLIQYKQHFGYAAILANITWQVQIVHELRQKAETDPLTGVANRRSFLSALKQEFATARTGLSFSILLLDFDSFKEINDRYGHPAGDKVLASVAQRIHQILREGDLLGRLGGDEFAILLPRTGQKSALEVAERVRAAVAISPVLFEELSLPVSISLGLATCDANSATGWKELYKAADLALYQAKASGRNRVAVWNAESPQ